MDRLVTILAAIAAPGLALLVDIQAISPTVSLDVGSIIAAAVGSYHGGKVVQKRSTTPRHIAAPAAPAPPVP